jgi:hypothetical protein
VKTRLPTPQTTRTVPSWCETTLARFGQNPYGENKYRIIWGWDRLTYVAENLDFREIAKNPQKIGSLKQVPKYFLNMDGELNRWILEKWMPPESFGSPEQWKKDTWDSTLLAFTLGPYPSRGEFEFCHAIQSEFGNPVEITPHLVSLIVALIEKGKNDYSFEERRQAIRDEYERADQEHYAKVAAIFQEAVEDVDRHIAHNPTILDDVKITHAVERPAGGIRQGKPQDKFRRVN